MLQEDKFSLEERTRIIGFHPDETNEYGIIKTPEFDDIKYRVRQCKPTENKLGILDIAFVVPLISKITVIETRFVFNKDGEFIEGKPLNISNQKYDRLELYGYEFFGRFEQLESYSKNLNFDYAKICHDKIMELYRELLK